MTTVKPVVGNARKLNIMMAISLAIASVDIIANFTFNICIYES